MYVYIYIFINIYIYIYIFVRTLHLFLASLESDLRFQNVKGQTASSERQGTPARNFLGRTLEVREGHVRPRSTTA